MKNELMWNEFIRTGDPLCYLMYRSFYVGMEKPAKEKERYTGV